MTPKKIQTPTVTSKLNFASSLANRHTSVESKEQSKQFWQVFYLPSSHGLVAFCPFTGIFTTGKDVAEASENWLVLARQAINCGVLLPRYMLTQRKVYTAPGHVFLVDSPRGRGYFLVDAENLVVSELSTLDELSTLADKETNGLMFVDDNVLCTHILHSSTCNSQPQSLTPHHFS